MTELRDGQEAAQIAAHTERAWIEATLAQDDAQLAALFAEDVVFLGSHPRMYVGKAQLREYLASVSGATPDAITFSGRQVRALTPDVFTTASYVTFVMRREDGSENSFRWAIAWTLARRTGSWEIVQHHASPRPET